MKISPSNYLLNYWARVQNVCLCLPKPDQEKLRTPIPVIFSYAISSVREYLTITLNCHGVNNAYAVDPIRRLRWHEGVNNNQAFGINYKNILIFSTTQKPAFCHPGWAVVILCKWNSKQKFNYHLQLTEFWLWWRLLLILILSSIN